MDIFVARRPSPVSGRGSYTELDRRKIITCREQVFLEISRQRLKYLAALNSVAFICIANLDRRVPLLVCSSLIITFLQMFYFYYSDLVGIIGV